MLTVEEESFALHILDVLENLRVDKRLLNIFECLANNPDDAKAIVKRLRNYHKFINKKFDTSSNLNFGIYNTNEIFNTIIEELYTIGKKLKWEEGFLEILKYYLNNRNILTAINFLSTYNELQVLSIELENS